MKKKSRSNGSIVKWGFYTLLWGTLILNVPPVWASTDLDRQYALETIGYLKSWDNLDGLFSEHVSSAYKDYFFHSSRFIVNDLSQANSVLSRSKLPYRTVIHDSQILGQLARSAHTESILRTEITKEGSQYFFTIEWLHSPKMDQIASVRFKLDEPGKGTSFGADLISGPLQANLNKLFTQVPFLANVTGRDNNSVTVSLGAQGKIKKGDLLVIATLDEVKRHPLLQTIVDWKLTPTGKLVVEQVEEGIAFCKVIEQEPGREIARYQKITQIQSVESPPVPKQTAERSSEPPSEPPSELPTLGVVSLSIPIGGYSWQLSSPVNSAAFSGGGFALGSKADGQVWLTRNWFVDLGFRYSFWGFSQKNTQTGTSTAASQAGGVNGSVTSLKVDAGYSYLITGDFLGPKGWLKLGYKGDSYQLPISTTEFTGPVSFGSLFVGIGGSLPILEKWGAIANFNMRVFSSVSQTWLNETGQGNSDVELYVGGSYRFSPKMSAQCGLEVISSDASFSAGTSISQKTITIAPQLLYYF